MTYLSYTKSPPMHCRICLKFGSEESGVQALNAEAQLTVFQLEELNLTTDSFERALLRVVEILVEQ